MKPSLSNYIWSNLISTGYKFILLNGMEPSRVMTLASRGSDKLFLMFSRRANLKSDKNMPHTQYGMKLDEKCIPAGGGAAALENGPRWLGKREHWGLRWLGGDITMRATGLDQMPHVDRDDDDDVIFGDKPIMMRVLRNRLVQVSRSTPNLTWSRILSSKCVCWYVCDILSKNAVNWVSWGKTGCFHLKGKKTFKKTACPPNY